MAFMCTLSLEWYSSNLSVMGCCFAVYSVFWANNLLIDFIDGLGWNFIRLMIKKVNGVVN